MFCGLKTQERKKKEDKLGKTNEEKLFSPQSDQNWVAGSGGKAAAAGQGTEGAGPPPVGRGLGGRANVSVLFFPSLRRRMRTPSARCEFSAAASRQPLCR